MIFVTFHGGPAGGGGRGPAATGKHPTGTSINQVYAYDGSGNLLCDAVLAGIPAGVTLSELRGLALVGSNLLWVLSGAKDASGIYCFRANGTVGYPYDYVGPVAAYDAPASALLHPFDLTFDGAGNVYVSNQDTNVVAAFTIGEGNTTARANGVAPALPAGIYWDGTVVASQNGALPRLSATASVPFDAGLAAEVQGGKLTNSVRGVTWADGYLYVADEVAGFVKVYASTGLYLGKSAPLDGPTHLLAGGGWLYASAGNQIWAAQLDAAQPAALTFAAVPGVTIAKVSGLAFDPSGTTLYAASRTGCTVSVLEGFSPTAEPSSVTTWPATGKLADQPEFLLDV